MPPVSSEPPGSGGITAGIGMGFSCPVWCCWSVGAANRAAAKAREAALDQIPVLEMSGVVQDLAQILITSGLIPPKAAPDAVHIAIAAVHGMEFLLTWNCRHIANAAIVDRVRRVCGGAGFPAPVICTPFELMT
ncbi:MAG: hypothetical protein AB7O66_02180 [Limisphaerales bacterium]